MVPDHTERRRSEERLRESEERFRVAFETSPDSINLNRLDDGLFVAVNRGFTRITGWTAVSFRQACVRPEQRTG